MTSVVAAAGPVALLFAGCGGTASSVSHSNTFRAAAAVAYAEYPALAQSAPSGITVVPVARARVAASTKSGPIWINAEPRSPAAVVPEIGSAREARHEGQTRIWIAKSNRGGVCVLVFRPQLTPDPARAHTIFGICGRADKLAKGVVLQATSPGETYLAGAVPSGVPDVSVHFTDGGTKTLPVVNNAYSISATRSVAGIGFARNGVEQTINLSRKGQ